MLAPASLLAPFSYTTLLWAVMIGLFVFGSLPDWLTVIGASILAGAGLYVWRRERIQARRARRLAEAGSGTVAPVAAAVKSGV